MAAVVSESSAASCDASSGPRRLIKLRIARLVVGSCSSGDSFVAVLAVVADSGVMAGPVCSRHDQVDVTELVPEVPLGERGGVRRLEERPPGDGLEHGEM